MKRILRIFSLLCVLLLLGGSVSMAIAESEPVYHNGTLFREGYVWPEPVATTPELGDDSISIASLCVVAAIGLAGMATVHVWRKRIAR